MNSLPPLIDDDALQVSSSATEEDNAQSPLLMPLSEDKKAMLCESLEGAHEELVHELLSVEASVCDLIEVCCGPNSSLSNELNHHGGSAYRVFPMPFFSFSLRMFSNFFIAETSAASSPIA